MRRLLIVGVLAGVLLPGLNPGFSRAAEYTADDSLEAIHVAAIDHGVAEWGLKRVANCETHSTFNPYAVGDYGTSFGLFQLHRGGLLGRFYAEGYSDPMNPYEAAEFTASVMAGELPGVSMRAWSCW